MRLLIQLILCLQLLMPVAAWAEPRDPLSYPLKQWALLLGLSIFGGIASWVVKVRKGELAAHNVGALVGEITVAAFAGVITSFLCDAANLGPLLTPAVTGISGYMGGRALALLERIVEKRLKSVAGGTGPAPLGDK